MVNFFLNKVCLLCLFLFQSPSTLKWVESFSIEFKVLHVVQIRFCDWLFPTLTIHEY